MSSRSPAQRDRAPVDTRQSTPHSSGTAQARCYPRCLPARHKTLSSGVCCSASTLSSRALVLSILPSHLSHGAVLSVFEKTTLRVAFSLWAKRLFLSWSDIRPCSQRTCCRSLAQARSCLLRSRALTALPELLITPG